jgi:hypothetical protein
VSLREWQAAPAFQFLSEALTDPNNSEGARRAVSGTRLLARAALEHRTDLKMLGVVGALEAWLLHRGTGSQTQRLARHVAWFGCGRQDNRPCRVERIACPYLCLDPDKGTDRKRISKLRKLGNTWMSWRCSEWHQVVDWYDSRSGAAHGDPAAVTADEARQAEFWVSHYLAEPIIEWLALHSDDPLGDLQSEMQERRPSKSWPAMLAALDAEQPPSVPPVP